MSTATAPRTMTAEQADAARQLRLALDRATSVGLLDLLNDNCASPDSINDVCDALAAALPPTAQEVP